MTYQAVVDRFPMPVPLDPLSATLFVALFAAVVVVTARRPAYGLSALILVTPFSLARDISVTTITLPKVALVGVLIGLCACPRAAARLRDRPVPLLLGAALAYAAVVALTAIDAAHRGPAARETFKYLQYAVTFAAAYLCRRVDADDAVLIDAMALAAIVVSATALAQEIVGAPSGLYVGQAIVPRIAGALEGPNQLAGYYQIAVAALGAWSFVRRSLLLDVALAVCVCADVLTFSRAGLLGLAVVVLVLIAFRGRTSLRALAPAAAGLAAGLCVVGWWAFYAHTVNVLRISLAESTYAGGVGDRRELWAAAWRMWMRHPIIGVGAGNYELDLPLYGVYGVRTHANSWFLQSLAEGGLALFAATLALVGAILATFLRALRR
ncbi:MAG TPA: O-antigen ligase family protein, partial [Candidatus Tumulicola sp.]|nr:O-antigen ligase family protein [Candidatus Tumulicola sp.]